MKIGRLILIATNVLLLSGIVNAQINLPLNSAGKVERMDVVVVDTVAKKELFDRASSLLTNIAATADKFTIIEKDSASGKIVCALKSNAYTYTGILKKQVGVITYSLALEVKDGKYRYTFTDFVYHYYAQNRNYQVVETGKKKGLEETKAPGWQKTWNTCRSSASDKVSGQISIIQTKMKEDKNAAARVAAELKKPDW
jgi:hypothetical protein